MFELSQRLISFLLLGFGKIASSHPIYFCYIELTSEPWANGSLLNFFFWEIDFSFVMYVFVFKMCSETMSLSVRFDFHFCSSSFLSAAVSFAYYYCLA